VNRDAVGARLELKLGDGSGSRFRTLRAGEGYLGQSTKWMHFGLGDAASVDRLVVRWPGGGTEEFSGIEPGKRYRIVQGSGAAAPSEGPPRKLVLVPSRLEAPAREEGGRVFLSAPVPAPVLAYRDLSGRPVTSANAGPLLVVLWTADCDRCFEDLDRLAARSEEVAAAGLRVLALNVGDTGGEAAPARVKLAGRSVEAGFAGPALRNKLDLILKKVVFRPRPISLPGSFLIDTDDLLAAIYWGPLSIEQMLEDLPGLRVFGERRLKAALPAEGRRQTRGWPSFFDYMDEVAGAYAEGGYPEEAVAYYRKVMRIKPGRIESHVNLASALSALGRTDEAITEYRAALEIDPDHAGAHRGLGDELGKQGDGEGAIAHYRAALETSPDDARVLSNLALALARSGNEDEAVLTYRRALAIEPDNVIALVNLGMALGRQGMTDEAVETLRRAVAADPGSPQAGYHLGRALFRRGDAALAIEHLENALRLEPGLGQAHYHLAVALAKQGRWEEAAGHLTASGRGMPGFLPEESLIWILATDGDASFRDGARAVDLAEKLLAQAPDERRVATLDALAAAYAEAGRFGEAVETAREAEGLAVSEGRDDTLPGIRFRLSAYEAGRPFHRGR
jgi:tetratricopeptide (TPR) repeat protein